MATLAEILELQSIRQVSYLKKSEAVAQRENRPRCSTA